MKRNTFNIDNWILAVEALGIVATVILFLYTGKLIIAIVVVGCTEFIFTYIICKTPAISYRKRNIQFGIIPAIGIIFFEIIYLYTKGTIVLDIFVMGFFAIAFINPILMYILFKILERVFKTKVKSRNPKIMILIYGILMIFSIGTLGITHVIRSSEIIITEDESKYIDEKSGYYPFIDNDNLVKLETSPSYTVDKLEQLPKMDGATAFFPIYASFVENIYKGELDKNQEADKDSYDSYQSLYEKSSGKWLYEYISCSKTPGAYQRLINKEVDIIFVLEASQEHIEYAKEKGVNLEFTPIGREAFVFFNHIDNHVNNLTKEDIQKIYTGEIKNWKEVKGADENILAFQRPENSGSQTTMLSAVMEEKKMKKPLVNEVVDGMGGIIHNVAEYQNSKKSIGYSFLYYLKTMNRNKKVKVISVDGVEANTATIKSKEYPFTQNIYAVTNGENNEKVKPFLDWILGEEGKKIIEKIGYVSVN